MFILHCLIITMIDCEGQCLAVHNSHNINVSFVNLFYMSVHSPMMKNLGFLFKRQHMAQWKDIRFHISKKAKAKNISMCISFKIYIAIDFGNTDCDRLQFCSFEGVLKNHNFYNVPRIIQLVLQFYTHFTGSKSHRTLLYLLLTRLHRIMT